jgi:uncharacterized protein YecT (DUF1311 family)
MLKVFTIAALLALAAGPAAAASFDCKKASTKVEKLICADPELSRQDEAMAAAYAEALKAWDGKIAAGTRMNQKGWVGSRSLLPPGMDQGGVYCTDDKTRLDCLRGLYRDRIAVLRDPAWRLGGIYERGRDILRIKVVPGGLDLAYQLDGPDALGGATQEGVPVKAAPGATTVSFPLAGEGRDACRLDGAFTAEAVTIAQKGPCSGNAVAGRWVRNQARDPEAELF